MKSFRSRPATALALAAAALMTASPVLARDYGWGGRWDRRHNDRIDGGDILAGVLIIGGIAAIASAASKSSRDRRSGDYRYPDQDDQRPDWREPSGGYGDSRDRDYRGGSDTRGADSIDDAVNRCASEVERGGNRRIDSVDGVNRDGDGWRVQGRTSSGLDYSCSIDGDGRVRNVTVDGRGV